jgi:hypothetical protein
MNRFHINNNANGNSHPAEQVSPAYSQNSLLSSSHYQLSSNPLGAQHEHFNPALINGIVVLWREFNGSVERINPYPFNLAGNI